MEDERGSVRPPGDRYLRLFRSIRDAVCVADTETGVIVDANDAAGRLMGVPRLQLVGRHQSDLHPPEEAGRYRAIFGQHLRSEVARADDVFVQRGDGTRVPVDISAATFEEGGRTLIQAIFRDLSTQEAARAAQRAAEDRYRRLVENLSDEYFFYSHDTDGVFTYLSPSAERITGRPNHDFLKHYTEYLADEPDPTEVVRHTELSIQGIRQPRYEVGLIRPDGSLRIIQVTEVPVRDEDGSVVAVEGIARDVTQHSRLREALEGERRLFGQVIERNPYAIAIADDMGLLRRGNTALHALLGEEVPLGVSVFEHPLFVRAGLADVAERVRSGEVVLCPPASLGVRPEDEASHGGPRWARGTVFPLLDAGGEIERIVVMLKDVTYEKQFEDQVIRSERLAAVGTLAGGIAHEFNNITTSVLGFADLLLGSGRLDEQSRQLVERLRRAGLRATGITGNLLAFAGATAGRIRAANLTRVVAETLELVEREWEKDGVTIVRELAEVPDTAMDADQIGQVVLNLLINAGHAVLEASDRRVLVRTASAQGWVVATVRDWGHGVAPEALPKLFSPFYSTKGEHAAGETAQADVKGTGLGLAVSHTIVTRHDGEILVESEPRRGAAFTVRLPIVAAPDPQPTAVHAARLPEGGGTVLVLDDEPDLLHLMQLVLDPLHRQVFCTSDGEAALDHLAAQSVDVALVDLRMPAMPRAVFLARLETLPPEQRPAVILVSGHLDAGDPVLGHPNVVDYLSKPFDLDDLVDKVAVALRAKETRA